MGPNHCQVHLTCCPTRIITCSFPSPQRAWGSDQPAGTGVGWGGTCIPSSQQLRYGTGKGNECAASPSWAPGGRAVHILSAASVHWFEEGILQLPGQCPCSDTAGHLPAQDSPWQHWTSDSRRAAVPFAVLAQALVLPSDKKEQYDNTWVAGDMDVQACLWLPALGMSVAQRWQKVLDWWLGIVGLQ